MSVSLRNELGIGGLVSAHQDFCLFPARQNFPQQPGGVRQDVALGSWGGGRRSWAPAPSAESQPLQADSAGRSGRFRLSRKKISLFFTRRTAAAS